MTAHEMIFYALNLMQGPLTRIQVELIAELRLWYGDRWADQTELDYRRV